MTTLVEACAGTAALTFALFDAKPPVPMAGSKRTLAPRLIEAMSLNPQDIDTVHLNDPSEWGNTLAVLFAGGWDDVAKVIEGWIPEHERILFGRLRTAPPDPDPVQRAAAHLYLQTRTYRGKPVYGIQTQWVTHGFDPEFRAGVKPGAKSRGWFNARPVLTEKIRACGKVAWPKVIVTRPDARLLDPTPGSIVFIDPPYVETIEYGHRFPRGHVEQVAREHAAAGARVFITEAEPLFSGVPTWTSVHLPTRRGGTQLAVHQEYLTFNREGPVRG